MLTLIGRSLVGFAVRLQSDNVFVVYYLNKQGETRSRRLTTAAERVFRLAENLTSFASCSHAWETQCSFRHSFESPDRH